MIMRMLLAIFLIMSGLLMSCTSVQTVSPHYLAVDDSKSITLRLHDDRVIRFRAGDYKVHRQGEASYVSGTGVVTKRGSDRVDEFSGRVYFHEVKEMEITDPPRSGQIDTLTAIVLSVVTITIAYLSIKVSNI